MQVMLLVVLFYVLGTCAESYFCPALAVLADLLHLSPDVAVRRRRRRSRALAPSLPPCERLPPLVGEISFSFDLIDAHGFGVTNGRESRSWHWAMELLMCSRPSLQ